MKCFGIRVCRLLFAAGVFLSFAGCGGRQGTVSGKVTLNGAPLPGGLVSIYDSEDQTRTSKINQDGSYTMSNVAPGPAKASVLTMDARTDIRDQGDGSRPKTNAFGPYVAIPPKYMNKDTSGLNLEVKSGKQDFDMPLKDEPKTEVK
jgi:hypothetical protein